MDDALLAFVSEPRAPAEIEIRVNFGVFAGREVTHAEIDDLARALYGELTSVAIVALRRHELADGHEAAAHQVKVEANLRDAYRERVATAELPADEAQQLNAALEAGLTGYTYLSDVPLD